MRRLLAACLAGAFALPLACDHHMIIEGDDAPRPTTALDAGPAEPVDASPPPPPPPPSGVTPVVIELGTVPIGTDVPFQLPPGAIGFNVVVEGTASELDPDRPYGIDRITDPDGTIVHDAFTPTGGTVQTSYAAFDTLATATVPQGEGAVAPLTSGTWKIRFGIMGDAGASPALTARVRVQVTGDGAFHGGRLDLHVHLPPGVVIGAGPVDTTAPESEPELSDRLDAFFALTEELLGITRGDVVFHSASAEYADVDGIDELLGAFATSKGTSKDGDQAMHVLFTNSISDQGQPFAVGISPGIPGTMNVFGRGTSGIVVASAGSVSDDVDTMIHEMGHFFGLNHTTELDGKSADPLDDTPSCPGISKDDLTACPDHANVMFPAGAIGGAPLLSPSQVRVYHGSTVYRALPPGTGHTKAYTGTSRVRVARTFRRSGGPLSPVESELALGLCGLVKIDAAALVGRHGATAVAQLRAAAADADLVPVIRGRARLALRALGL